MPEPCAIESEMAIEELKRHKSPGIDQILAELIKVVGRTIHSEIRKLITSIWNKETCLGSARNRSLYLSIRSAIKHTVVTIGAYYFCQLRSKFYPSYCCQGGLHTQRKLLGIFNVDFDSAGQLLIIYSAFVKYVRRIGSTVKQWFGTRRCFIAIAFQLCFRVRH